MLKNVAGQKIRVFAFNRTDNVPKTGDAANITLLVENDFDGTPVALADVNPTEDTSGYYLFNVTKAESNHLNIEVNPISSTADIQVIGVPGNINPKGVEELGYTNGFVYWDSGAGNTNSVPGVDGTIDNKVSSWAAAKSLAEAIGYKKVNVGLGLITVNTDADGFVFEGASEFSAVTISSSPSFKGVICRDLSVGVVAIGDVDINNVYERCIISTNHDLGGKYTDCRYDGGNLTVKQVTTIIRGFSRASDNFITLLFAGGAQNVNIVGGFGVPEIRVQTMTNSSDRLNIFGYKGDVNVNVNCTDGDIKLFGDSKIIGGTGGVAIDKAHNGLLNWSGDDIIGSGANMIEDDGSGAKRWTEKALEKAPGSLAGYVGGYVYYLSGAPAGGTVVGTDGTLKTPTGSEVNALALANATNRKIWIIGKADGAFNLATDAENIAFYGNGAGSILNFNVGAGTLYDEAAFHNIRITGEAKDQQFANFYHCHISLAQTGNGLIGELFDCIFQKNKEVFVGNEKLELHNCSVDEGTLTGSTEDKPAQFKMLGASSTLLVHNFDGQIEVTEMTGATDPQVRVHGNGSTTLILAADPAITTGYVYLSGTGVLVDNGATLQGLNQGRWQNLPFTDTSGRVNLGKWLDVVVTAGGDWTALAAAVAGIQNNTDFTAAIPGVMDKPDTASSPKPYEFSFNIYDENGDMVNPENDELMVRTVKTDGTYITADNMKTTNGLTTNLPDATNQGDFPTASGWRAMEGVNNPGTGIFNMFYKLEDTTTEEPLKIEMGWKIGSKVKVQSRFTQIFNSDAQHDAVLAGLDEIKGATFVEATDALDANAAAVATRATPAQILTTALTQSYSTLGAEATLSQLLYELIAEMREFDFQGQFKNVKKLDHTTAAYRNKTDNAINPTRMERDT